jgi:hypothetical protein
MIALPPWAATLEGEIAAAPGSGFRWLEPDRRDQARDLTLRALDEYPYGEALQARHRARVERCVVLASGPSRTVRLTGHEHPSIILFDPELPGRVVVSLGVFLPPVFWPSAAPTLAGIQAELSPYFSSQFTPRAELTRTIRIGRETLDELGFDDLAEFARTVGQVERWLDHGTAWHNALDDDPWPADPSSLSMIDLRLVRERAQQTARGRRPSVSMRTLWSRSIVTIELGLFGKVVFEFRYDPAPFVAEIPFVGGGDPVFPTDLPVDLAALLLRGLSIAPETIRRAKANGPDPRLAVAEVVLEPGEATSFSALVELAASKESLAAMADIADAASLRGVLYRVALDDRAPEDLRAWATDRLRLGPPPAEAESSS